MRGNGLDNIAAEEKSDDRVVDKVDERGRVGVHIRRGVLWVLFSLIYIQKIYYLVDRWDLFAHGTLTKNLDMSDIVWLVVTYAAGTIGIVALLFRDEQTTFTLISVGIWLNAFVAVFGFAFSILNWITLQGFEIDFKLSAIACAVYIAAYIIYKAGRSITCGRRTPAKTFVIAGVILVLCTAGLVLVSSRVSEFMSHYDDNLVRKEIEIETDDSGMEELYYGWHNEHLYVYTYNVSRVYLVRMNGEEIELMDEIEDSHLMWTYKVFGACGKEYEKKEVSVYTSDLEEREALLYSFENRTVLLTDYMRTDDNERRNGVKEYIIMPPGMSEDEVLEIYRENF